MVICDRTLLRKDVRAHFDKIDKVYGKLDKKLMLRKFYMVPKLLKFIKKMQNVNEIFFKERITDHSITKTFFTFKEMKFLNEFSHLSSDNFTKYWEKEHPLPSDVVITPVIINKVPCEWNNPKNSPDDKVLIYFHGGGYVLGSVNQDRRFTAPLSKMLGIKILSVDYRLAPMFTYTSQIEDAIAVYNGLLNKGYSSENIMVSGSSAGAHLALTTLLKIKDDKLPNPKGAILLSPLTDSTISDPSFFENGPTDVILGDICVASFIAAYLGDINADHPLISPLFADLTYLPPLLFIASECEMLYSDSVRIVENAKNQGVDATLRSYKDMPHVFPVCMGDNAPFPEIDQSITDMKDFLKKLDMN
jgi:monoterpene epsilon-lactone hydrolase